MDVDYEYSGLVEAQVNPKLTISWSIRISVSLHGIFRGSHLIP